MSRYYDQSSDGWVRIAVVDWTDEAAADGRFGVEIDESDLPNDFESWSSYERFAHSDCTVDVRSATGE